MFKTATVLRRLADDLFSLIYPRLCLICSRDLPPYTHSFCLSCKLALPETNFHLLEENPFTDRFWGRLPLESGAAMLYFRKHGTTQRLMHRLKYQGKKEIGVELGRRYGLHLKGSPCFRGLDGIVSVPLHPKRKRARGYNQSDCFAQGLSESLGIPHWPNALLRPVETESQTTKSRFERLENMQDAFRVAQPKLLRRKHILLVDDVLTTGATLEACALKLLEIPETRVSMATIAIAE